ncbi:LytTR family DNA-binding domain-containing protein [Lactobacillus sp. ESL0684]|uniref:LytTR family DNA-binding domain-containing protein n=1 Tax=Lactobacillus sp. ESL0684 TaxID=2983213 RepID=UPI0023F9BE58|nr:LytTR family DNA-binding domain-containing protein [Lactobacillus sp. ESL0684]WEV44160.1 LytTR family DNA-binding domain-containing protein [Lactobacillus sp. ESL0684]
MKLIFETNPEIDPQEPTIIIQAAKQTDKAAAIMAALEHFQAEKSDIIPVKTSQQLNMVKTKSIILVDLVDNLLVIYTVDGILKTKETLVSFHQKLTPKHFLQVSRHAIINVDYLLALEDSFSGNLTAKLAHQLTTSVSRKYVKDLMHFLGI